jgi:exoribonuclease R
VPVSSLRLKTSSRGELAASLSALRDEFGLSGGFPPEAEKEAASAVERLVLPETDRRDIPLVTIDPVGATDLDQAMHLARDGDGYRVFYAIADVPAFVIPEGAVDAEARRRGQTVYAPDGRIPLHPLSISEDAASLLPDRLRGAFVWDFALDAGAAVVGVHVARATVRSTRQCSYEQVQAELDAGTASEPLRLLEEIGEKRIALERARGGANLNRPDEEITEENGVYRLERRKALPVEDWNAQISLMTGMAAAKLMLDGGIGILRTMPEPAEETIVRFRRQAAALGSPWGADVAYGEYLRRLDSDDPRGLAILHAAGSLFRGAGYTAFDGAAPEQTTQAAVGAPYAHATAPLRRLVDRFVLVTCEALCAGNAVPEWVRTALTTLPALMERSDAVASRLDHAAIDAVEAAILRDRVGERFVATVISAREGGGVVQLADPAVTADCAGDLEPGSSVRVTLVAADIAKRQVAFRLA